MCKKISDEDGELIEKITNEYTPILKNILNDPLFSDDLSDKEIDDLLDKYL